MSNHHSKLVFFPFIIYVFERPFKEVNDYTLFYIKTHFIRTSKLRSGKKIRTN